MAEFTGGDARFRIAACAIVGIVVATGLVWYVSGGPFFELLPRVAPTVEGGGVGTDWANGRVDPLYGTILLLTKGAVALATAGLVYMVTIHWAVFERLASRMQSPDRESDVVADGGRSEAEGGEGR